MSRSHAIHPHFILVPLALTGLSGCIGGGYKSDSASGVAFEDATVLCDPTASAFDDLFLFEAWTSGDAVSVEVEVKDGGDSLDELALEEEDSGYWAREVWADDLGTDCDNFKTLRFKFQARGADGSEAEAEAAG